jgi:hypothetical protein
MAPTHPLLHHARRGYECVDGSLPDFFFGNCELLTKSGGAVVFDYFDDHLLERQGRMDMLKLTSYDDIRRRMMLGYNYAQRLHEQGAFDKFHLDAVMLQGGHIKEVGHMEMPQQQPASPRGQHPMLQPQMAQMAPGLSAA